MTGLIITDSLGLPRYEVEKEDTWVFNLMSNSKNINYMYLKRGGTTKDLKTVMVNFDYLKPDYIILQFGICDCTRRVKPRKLAGMKRKLRGGGAKLNRIVYKLINKYMFFFTRIFRLYDVNITDFSRNLLEFIEFYKKQHEEVKIYICAIADAGTKLCEKVFSIQEDINQYNLVLEKICSSLENVFFINPYKKASEEYVLAVDGHHLNKYGNKLLFDELMKNLEEGNML